MRKKIANLISLLLNLLVIGFTAYSMVSLLTSDNEAGIVKQISFILMLYTNLSNLFCAITCIPVVIEDIRILSLPRWVRDKERRISGTVLGWKLVGTASVTVTMLTVLFFLSLQHSLASLLAGEQLFLHLVNPLLAILSFVFFDRGRIGRGFWIFAGCLPVLLYGIVYYLMVMVFETWMDFYGFATVLKWYISAPVMLIGALLVSLVLYLLHLLFNRSKAVA